MRRKNCMKHDKDKKIELISSTMYKPSVDVAMQHYNAGMESLKKAIAAENTDILKSIAFYSDAEKKFNMVRCQTTASADLVNRSQEAASKCSRRIQELAAFLKQNQGTGVANSDVLVDRPKATAPNGSLQHLPQAQQQCIQQISTQPIPPPNQQQIQQIPNQIPIDDDADLQIPSFTINDLPTDQTIDQTQIVPPPQNIPKPLNDSPSQSYFNESCSFVSNGISMENDGFFDLAIFFYSRAVFLLMNYSNSPTHPNYESIQLWLSQLSNRTELLKFYQGTNHDSSSFYFHEACSTLNLIKTLQDHNTSYYIDQSIMLLKKCITVSGDAFLTNMAKQMLSYHMQANNKISDIGILDTSPILKSIPSEHINVPISADAKVSLGQLAIPKSVSSISSFKILALIYGPPGTYIEKFARFAAFTSSVQQIIEVDFLRFIGSQIDPAVTLHDAFEKCRSATPMYLHLKNIDSVICCNDNDNFSNLLLSVLLNELEGKNDGIVIICTATMPWRIHTTLLEKFTQVIFNPPPDENRIREIVDSNIATKSLNDQIKAQLVKEFVGYIDRDINRILIEAQINNVMKCAGKTRLAIFTEMANGTILTNLISIEDVKMAKRLIKPSISPIDLTLYENVPIVKK